MHTCMHKRTEQQDHEHDFCSWCSWSH